VKKDQHEGASMWIMMEIKKYVFWKDDDMWLGYLDDMPSHLTKVASKL